MTANGRRPSLVKKLQGLAAEQPTAVFVVLGHALLVAASARIHFDRLGSVRCSSYILIYVYTYKSGFYGVPKGTWPSAVSIIL